MAHLDFQGLNKYLLRISRQIVVQWLPGGKLDGSEWTCGSVNGEAGSSCKVNIDTGKWSDFAAAQAGGDLVSLYAEINNLSPGDSYRALADEHGYGKEEIKKASAANADSIKEEKKLSEEKFIKPPKGTPLPFAIKSDTPRWIYRDYAGDALFVIARFNKADGKKDFRPYSWNGEKWIAKIKPDHRPLYGLEHLDPKKAVLIVEGEKAAEAARLTAGKVYSVICSQGGSNAWRRTDWSPIFGKKILIWPDADPAGEKYAQNVANLLLTQCEEIKVIDIQGIDKGLDAADFKFTWQQFKDFAKPRARIFEAKSEAITPEIMADEVPFPDEPPPVINQLVVGDDAASEIMQADAPKSVTSIWVTSGMLLNKENKPHQNISNCRRLIPHTEFAGDIWYDEFYRKIRTTRDCKKGKSREWEDSDTLDLLDIFQHDYQMPRVTENTAFNAALAYARKNIKNEPKDWMESLVWDGVSRIDNFMVTHFGAVNSQYIRDVSKNWWLCMAVRILQPGAKVDNMVSLESTQGKLKSSTLRMIANDGEWFIEAKGNILHKDFWGSLQGKLIIEIAELGSFKQAHIEDIKMFISMQEDKYRIPYGRNEKNFPRTCVFVGTTNETEYLRDHTGSRRIWPVAIGEILFKKTQDDRDQLFAEAVHRIKAGEKWWTNPAGADEEQELRREKDPWENFFTDYVLKTQRTEITIEELLTDCLLIDKGRVSMIDKRRAGKALRALRWPCKISSRLGKTVRLFHPHGYTPELAVTHPAAEKKILKIRNMAPGADNSHMN